MVELLETTMLICFGLSWPVSVTKNIRAGTAKTMSLQFILLIAAGYIAGISAKIVSGKTNYVLAAYFINLLFVSANVVVYIVNRKKDQMRCTEVEENEAMQMNQKYYETELKRYGDMNRLAKSGGIVFFGSDIFYRMEVGELANAFGVSDNLYNRSIHGLKVEETPAVLKECVTDLMPKSVFVEIGNYDKLSNTENAEKFFANYEWLLYTIHNKTKAKIYLVFSGQDDKYGIEMKKGLEQLASEVGCEFVDITRYLAHSQPELKVFEQLRFYIREGKIDFYDSINPVIVQ